MTFFSKRLPLLILPWYCIHPIRHKGNLSYRWRPCLQRRAKITVIRFHRIIGCHTIPFVMRSSAVATEGITLRCNQIRSAPVWIRRQSKGLQNPKSSYMLLFQFRQNEIMAGLRLRVKLCFYAGCLCVWRRFL